MKCSDCFKVKPEEEFSKRPSDSYQFKVCKDCMSLRRKAYADTLNSLAYLAKARRKAEKR